LEGGSLMKKQHKTAGSPRRTFKNLDDISLFEQELMQDELKAIGIDLVDKPLPNGRERRLQSFYNPKTKKYVRLDPTDPEQVELIKKHGLETFPTQLTKDLEKIPHGLAKDLDSFYQMQVEPLVFDSKGKTPPSVPYLRVFVDSSFSDDETAIHFVHNKARKTV